jgi:hypothetical protein
MSLEYQLIYLIHLQGSFTINQQHFKVYHLVSKPSIFRSFRYLLLLTINIISRNIKPSELKRIPLYFRIQEHFPSPTYALELMQQKNGQLVFHSKLWLVLHKGVKQRKHQRGTNLHIL